MQHAELVTLALVAGRPRHSYELNKQLDAMQVRQWAKLGTSTVYKVLQRLAAKGLVQERSERKGRRPPRKVYSITPNGRKTLHQLIVEGLASRAPAYSDRLVAAVFAITGANDVSSHMAEGLERLSRSEERLTEALGMRELSPIGRIIIEFQRAQIRAEQSALAALAKLRNELSSTDDEAPIDVPLMSRQGT